MVAIRLMAYRESPNSVYEYLKMYERNAYESLYILSKCDIKIFGGIYLQKPSLNYVQNVTHEKRHGSPDMLRSIDYMS